MQPFAKRSQTPLFMVLTAAIVFACYLPTLGNGFVWDDTHNLVENINYRGLSLSHLYWMFTTFHDANYHPLTWLSLASDFTIWEMNPFGYHLTNLVLHLLNTLLFYVLIVTFLRREHTPGAAVDALMIRASAVAGALFFAVHPLRVETVAWVSTRGDLLCGFFYILTLLVYVRSADSTAAGHRRQWLLLALLCFMLSLLSRAWGMTLPLVLLILDLYPLRRYNAMGRSPSSLRKVVTEKIPFIVFALLAAILALGAKKGSMLKVAEHSVVDRLVQASYGLCIYLWKTVMPLRISAFYLLDKNFNPFALKYIVCLLFVIGLTAGLIFLRRTRPWALTAWVCYAVTVSPLLGFVQSGPQIAADRYTYIACMPFGVLLGAGMHALWTAWQKWRLSKAAWLTGVNAIWAGLLVLSILSFRHTRVWRDDFTYWSHVLELDADNYIAYNNRGVFLKDHAGDRAGALADFTNAVALNPEFAGAYYNRGLLLGEQGHFAAAIDDFTRALRHDPENEKAYNNRGVLHRKQGNLDGALADFNAAIRLNPASPEGYVNRGLVWEARKDFEKAIEDLNKALNVAPDRWVYKARAENILAEVRARLIGPNDR